MKTLQISIEIKGVQTPVGTITGNDRADAVFQYSEDYLAKASARPISLSLPLRAGAFSAVRTRNYFEGLLPEGFTRKSVAHWMHVDENDYLSILSRLGNECLGALKVTEEGIHALAPSYRLLSASQVAALAREGTTRSAQLVTEAHLSLTGASGKAGLYYEGGQKSWYLPTGDAPSTHIVKQSHIRLDGIVTNEQLCLSTAKKLGIETPESFIINLGNAAEDEVLLATRRFDRVLTPECEELRGLPRPRRLHQEDFAQALAVSSSDKYERTPDQYLPSAFRLLRSVSSDPISDQQKLWDILVFDYLAGNTDNHIKNLSLLYSDDLKTIRLAPAYDILSTAVYESSTRDMAISVGGEFSLDQISRDSFKKAAGQAGLGVRMAMRRFDHLADHFSAALREAASDLTSLGFERAAPISEKILTLGGIGRL